MNKKYLLLLGLIAVLALAVGLLAGLFADYGNQSVTENSASNGAVEENNITNPAWQEEQALQGNIITASEISAANQAIDLEQEIKNFDASISGVSEKDFDSGGLSDKELGL